MREAVRDGKSKNGAVKMSKVTLIATLMAVVSAFPSPAKAQAPLKTQASAKSDQAAINVGALAAAQSVNPNMEVYRDAWQLHDYFKSYPMLAAGYLQGVIDAEVVNAAAKNEGRESGLHVCMTTTAAAKMNAHEWFVVFDDWYSKHPEDKDDPAALMTIDAITHFCGLKTILDPAPVTRGRKQ
jgi:hypothetical protein